MKNLWAPWRMSYIMEKKAPAEACFFDAAPEKNHDRHHLILYRNAATVVLLNRYPYANGHLLVAPARHVATLLELAEAEAASLIAMVRSATAILEKHLRPDGFNIGLNLGEVAGAGIADHLHFHIIPRWSGDHNFMATVAEIRTIPEHIEQTFDRLLPDFQSLAEIPDE
ncbi:MAG: HIT domain-containing protein [Proteobacteria bacterium]|nr:HIT domain-containing protein [Pseudomonadota bacterium]MBU1738815.1 HIT domain-containing protein [Pseudomonadota bacterium]